MTFNETKQYASDIVEILKILLEHALERDKSKSLYYLNEDFVCRFAAYGSTGHEYKFIYKGQHIGANGFLNLDYEDESWCESTDKCSQYYSLWQEHRKVVTTYNKGIAAHYFEYNDFLKHDELTEEYYEQLQFVHHHDIVRNIFIMSYLNLHCSQFVYQDHYDLPSPGELLKIIKDTLCSTQK